MESCASYLWCAGCGVIYVVLCIPIVSVECGVVMKSCASQL